MFVNMVYSDEHKILIKKYITSRDIMRDSWGQDFRTKDGRQVTVTGSEEVQRHGHSGQMSGQRQTVKCPQEWKHWPGERYGS